MKLNCSYINIIVASCSQHLISSWQDAVSGYFVSNSLQENEVIYVTYPSSKKTFSMKALSFESKSN